MAEQFYTILTQIGKAKIANASALGNKVNFTHFALGDGDGSYYNPVESQTELKNEVWRGQIGSVTVDEGNPNWLVIETIIPANIGGFMIREAGVFDEEGNLLAIGKYPETYKPAVEYGSAKDLYVRMILEVANTSVVNLKVDPTVILATKKDIDILTNRIAKNEIDISTLQKEVSEHKAEITSQEVGKGADVIGLPDPNDLFTATNVGGAMQELFTNVSNGKQLVGGAIADIDDNVVIPTDPTFKQLANAIGQISTGKKWASGSESFSEGENGTNITLDFTPFIVLVYKTSAGRGDTMVYLTISDVGMFYGSKLYNYILVAADTKGNFINPKFETRTLTNIIYILNPDLISANTVKWIAYE
ncbi:phage tail protein [Sporanaerobacter acetigenes]|uniref:phage tail protein n=1 Tax=Sporanaerobacter acetigenes TaxID=165813 RepID=UPI00332CB4F5